MTSLREKRILPLVGRCLFSSPYLPRPPVFYTLVLIFTNLVFILVAQPAEYWLDYSFANISNLWMKQLLSIHPLVFIGVAAIYAIIVALLLDGLTRSLSTALWMGVCFLHLQQMLLWLDNLLERLFGLGSTSVHIVADAVLSVAFAGVLGVLAARALLPSRSVSIKSAGPKVERWLAVAGVIWLLTLIAGLVHIVNVPVSHWRPVVTDISPTPRVNAATAYDLDRQRAVLFGGLSGWFGNAWVYESDTWEWDGASWEECSPEIHPSARGSHAMAYDEGRDVAVLFGGINHCGVLSDTWEWDGEHWEQIYPQNIPPARKDHRMFYDKQRNGVVLYGGFDTAENVLNDAWEWDGSEWHHIPFESSSPAAIGLGLVYDEAFGRVVAFIGTDGTWVWQDTRWGRLPVEMEPPERTGMGLAYDPQKEHIVLFGGGGYTGQVFNDTWVLEGEIWRDLNPPLPPPARWGHTIFYDYNRERVIIFGGFGEDYLNDMWELVLIDGCH